MKKTYLVVLFVLLCSGVTVAQDQAGPSFSPIDIYACNYVKGKDRADLDKVVASWNEWMDSNQSSGYAAWVLTPDYNSSEYPFQVAWLGAWADPIAMGKMNDQWFNDGGEQATNFAKVLDCAVHSNFASLELKAGVSEQGENAVLSFADCTVGEASSNAAAVSAARDWVAFSTAQGSVSSQWLFFPAFGGPANYDFKNIIAHPNHTEFGADYDRYVNQGGFQRSAEIIGDTFECGVARTFHSQRVRDGQPPAR